MKKMETIQGISLTSYGQYNITSSEAEKILAENGYTVFQNPNDKNTAGYEYVGEGFFGMDDSMIGSTAYAKCARPIIYSIYKKKENYEEARQEELKKLEEEEDEDYRRKQEEKEKLETGKTKITVEIEEMKRGYSLQIKTANYEKFSIKQKNVKEIENNIGLEREELCRYIEKNYQGIRSKLYIRLSDKSYRVEDNNFNF